MTDRERFERISETMEAFIQADLEQRHAALRNTAELLGYFRKSLVDSGFSSQAAEDIAHMFASTVLHG